MKSVHQESIVSDLAITHYTQQCVTQLRDALSLGERARVNIALLSREPTSLCFRATLETASPENSSPFFIKIPIEINEISIRNFQKEIEFYHHISEMCTTAEQTTRHVLPRFIDGCASATKCLLILEDLSQTHQPINRYTLPTNSQIERMIHCLATIHSEWWGSHHHVTSLPSEVQQTYILTDFMRGADTYFHDFVLNSQFHLSGKHIQHFKRLFERLPERLQQRLFSEQHGNHHHLTLIHSDPHPGNFLLHQETASLKLIDWQDWKISFSAHDLVHLVISSIDISKYVFHDIDLLNIYMNALSQHIKHHFSFEQLLYDYRLGILRSLCVPIRHWKINLPAHLWMPQLTHSLAACDRLNCWELLA
ncbi:DUF1679 domain-containing protein [Vibrio ruber]|uniref:oxidoreductase family protein n=1 Tax=Vibrio ruber TaxID=184755 RepID=UPI00289352F8|nr:oxidoreductase family protein [Vibrio ruber]WNJ96295.1 DUF1679 domain-containing protein [Vibrio ruber]